MVSMGSKRDADPVEAWGYFLRLHAEIVARIEADLAAAGCISLTWYDVLLAVDESPAKRLRMSDIAKEIVLSRSALTRSVDRLVDAGYLRREDCPKDRRGCYAAITPAGEKALAKAWPVYRKGIQTHFSDPLDPGDVPLLLGLLRKVHAPICGASSP